MRRLSLLVFLATAPILTLTAPPPAHAALESGDRLKGIVERVEAGRFLVDSAWVEPGRGARFQGTARNVSRIRVGDWAVLDGRLGGRQHPSSADAA